jgi:hypothetical protein
LRGEKVSSAIKDWLVILAVFLGMVGYVSGIFLLIDKPVDPSRSSEPRPIRIHIPELKDYKERISYDLHRLEFILEKIESGKNVDKETILEFAKICAKSERLLKLFKSKDFCLWCAIKHKDHSHWDSNGYMITDKIAAKNDLDFLLKDPDEKDPLVKHYAFFILITPKEEYLPALKQNAKQIRSFLKRG